MATETYPQSRPAILNPLFQPISNLSGLGNRFSSLIIQLLNKNLRSEGHRVKDLLYLLPQKILERVWYNEISKIQPNCYVIFQAKVTSHDNPLNNKLQIYKKSKKLPYRILVSDGTGVVELIYFQQKGDWLKRQYPIGAEFIISGYLENFQQRLQISHPDYILPPSRKQDLPLFEPIYPLTKNLPQKTLQKSMKQALAVIPALPEWLPQQLINKYQLPNWQQAMVKLHNPTHPDELNPASAALTRLALDEIIAWQLILRMAHYRQTHQNFNVTERAELKNRILKKAKLFHKIPLPFKLTQNQNQVIDEIEKDLLSEKRMARLLMGDVGSGKTIIALYAMLRIVEKNQTSSNKQQVALLAPTEILAEQHFAYFTKLLQPLGYHPLLLTGSHTKQQREDKLKTIASGQADIILGTHALMVEDVVFHNLQLLVIDEQQRFGVKQRMQLYQKGKFPDLLLMSATPIPRSLSLVLYGDLEISVLKEKPFQTSNIKTAIMEQSRLNELMARLQQQTNAGKQAFWVCPLIETSDFVEMAAAEQRFGMAKNYFPIDQLALLHGRMPAKEKQQVINDFQLGKIKLLIATTVVETGIDIPKASIMIIDHAEHFGLAQLHQLRGRVGRDGENAYTILLYKNPLNDKAKERLSLIKQSNDGFFLAEEDLRLRGAGDRYGLRQSGFYDFLFFEPLLHQSLLLDAKHFAEEVVTQDPTLQQHAHLNLLLALNDKDRAIPYIQAG